MPIRVVLPLALYFALSALSKLSYTFPGAVPQAFIFRAVGAPILFRAVGAPILFRAVGAPILFRAVGAPIQSFYTVAVATGLVQFRRRGWSGLIQSLVAARLRGRRHSIPGGTESDVRSKYPATPRVGPTRPTRPP